MFNNLIVETIVNNIVPVSVEQYGSAMITVLLRYCSTNNAVTTCVCRISHPGYSLVLKKKSSYL